MYSERIWISALLMLALASLSPAQIGVLRIQIVEGEGTVHPPGARSLRPLTVEIADESGKPVENAAVSFHVPEEGPGGTFANGLRTVVVTTDARGRAGVRGMLINRTPGRFQIRIIASREQARAGAVSFQFVGVGAQARKGGRGKWIGLAALLGGGAAAGVLAAGRSKGAPSAAAPVPPTAPAAVSIGTPTVTVGKP